MNEWLNFMKTWNEVCPKETFECLIIYVGSVTQPAELFHDLLLKFNGFDGSILW